MRKAEKRLGEEIERVVNYLDPSSEAHITKVVESELIGKQVSLTAWQAGCHGVVSIQQAFASCHSCLVEYATTSQMVVWKCSMSVMLWHAASFSTADDMYLLQITAPITSCSLQMRALVEMENSGLVVLLEQDQYDNLARMYSLFKRLDDGLGLIRKMMGDHLKAAGSALVQDPESIKDPVDFVHRLLAMKDKYDRYRHAFCILSLASDMT